MVKNWNQIVFDSKWQYAKFYSIKYSSSNSVNNQYTAIGVRKNLVLHKQIKNRPTLT